ncbi:MAG: efflux RND transporter periplasmic adaptor subunit [Alphaproteobacteria bacterium]|nr:efflux RND transporter periplasmic adaptor subunit [Alphaproteobacteria bacterium]
MSNIAKLFDQETATHTDKEPSKASADGSSKGKRKKLFAGLAATVAILGGGYYAYDEFIGSRHATTDNAYVGADIAQVTPLVGGPVSHVLVDDTRHVRQGDVLVRLDDTDFRIACMRAQAGLSAAKANLTKARIDLQRRRALVATGSVSGDELTAAQDAYDTAVANLRAAQAASQQARVDLSRTVLRAPIDGVISKRQVQVGQRVQAGTPLMAVVPLQAAYVDANFKEVQLAKVHPGQVATLTSDLYGDKIVYQGRVVGFSGGTGAAFAVVPAQNATGNWIKVVQRLPVRIALDPKQLAQHPLQVGLSMNVDVNVSS